MKIINKKKGQVWIETVLYTLIALALIGLVLGFVMPKINQTKDKLLIEQTINLLTLMDDKINRAAETVDTSRRIEFTIKKGELYINSSSNEIVFVLDKLGEPYSSPGKDGKKGPVIIMTESDQKDYRVRLSLDYSSRYNLTYSGTDEDKKFNPSPTPYFLMVKNKGMFGAIQLDIYPING